MILFASCKKVPISSKLDKFFNIFYGCITDQVNTSHSTVIDSTPYEVVYGRQPKLTPLFGREGLVVEDGAPDQHDHSYSTAYDQSDTEVTNQS